MSKRKMVISECKVCGKTPESGVEIVDGVALYSVECESGTCCAVYGSFTLERAIQHWNDMQGALELEKPDEAMASVAKMYKDLEGHGLYQKATIVEGFEEPSKLTFREDFKATMAEVMNAVDKIPEDTLNSPGAVGSDGTEENSRSFAEGLLEKEVNVVITDRIPADDEQVIQKPLNNQNIYKEFANAVDNIYPNEDN